MTMNRNNTSDLEIESRHYNSVKQYRRYLCLRHVVKYVNIIAGMISVLITMATGVTVTTNHQHNSHQDVEIVMIWISAATASVISACQVTGVWLDKYLDTKKSRILVIADIREQMNRDLIGVIDTQEIEYIKSKYYNKLEQTLYNIDSAYIKDIDN